MVSKSIGSNTAKETSIQINMRADRKATIDKTLLLFRIVPDPENHYQVLSVVALQSLSN